MIAHRRLCYELAALTFLVASSVQAQSPRITATATDSSGVLSEPAANPWPQRAWVGAGLGTGTWPYGTIAGIVSGWYSIGMLAAGARAAGADAIFGEQRSDRALLMGVRTRGSGGFLLGGLGVGKIATSRTCDGPCTPLTRPGATEVAYSAEAHGNFELVGLGIAMFGVFGPPQNRYNAVAITLNVGWFGR